MSRSAAAPVAADGPVRRFSRVALGLVVVAVATGVVNAGLILPMAHALWSSAYGVTLLIKVGVLAVPLALATFSRRGLRRAVSGLRPAIRRAVRIEAALVLLVVGGGSILAVSAPAAVEADRPMIADVPMPALAAYQGQDLLVHLRFTPGRASDNAFTVQLADYDRTPYTGPQPSLVRLRFISLETAAESAPVDASPTPDGWTASGSAMSLDGWWQVEVTLRWLGQADVVVPFHLLLPDPNLNGMDAPRTAAGDPAAAALYAQAMAAHTGMHRVRFTQVMASHTGFASLAQQVVNDGADGSTPGFTYTARGGWEYVVLGTTGWTKLPGQPWKVSDVNPMIPPVRWDDEYVGATGFRLGRTAAIGGEECQLLTFVVPAIHGQVIAWYAWWVGKASGVVKQEMMVSQSHYMLSVFSAIDAPAIISPPLDAHGTPVAAASAIANP